MNLESQRLPMLSTQMPLISQFSLVVVSLLAAPLSVAAPLRAVLDQDSGTLQLFRNGQTEPILTQNAKPDCRPYIHPILAPDGQGELTQYSPGNCKHQESVLTETQEWTSMPEELFAAMSDDAVLAWTADLRTQKQVPLPSAE